MVRVCVYYIAKNTKDLSDTLCEEQIGLVNYFGVKLGFVNLMSKGIKEAQRQNQSESQEIYTKEFLKVFREKDYKISLSPNGKKVDSIKFANYLKDKSDISFFIGGAYGLSHDFIQKCDENLSLSDLTFSHKIAKIILSEQIYRGFCILNNHPYHK
ncbi:23S rRNA (pseudouridine(1915)-N(3))-methyltransferase RlmH [Helicobacter sp. WB40]|uniref:23S rRNA (pseudouridine(1915)-N(3))-methyltransferase RlmH n=1 Tax=Helicobacter sp. WB40 TaxID=3004130 RepID=UPI0022EC014C|nr:23S rRNA (pseudouridine(1915)-N(3))-methyltransferase RlmH [Helicobacter sp. WB40]MDA3966957.1 23S rRNA (pseudouridine(1915)-N(3))-methyltransferase RlmH [Helicobacter sp. WB40]